MTQLKNPFKACSCSRGPQVLKGTCSPNGQRPLHHRQRRQVECCPACPCLHSPQWPLINTPLLPPCHTCLGTQQMCVWRACPQPVSLRTSSTSSGFIKPFVSFVNQPPGVEQGLLFCSLIPTAGKRGKH